MARKIGFGEGARRESARIEQERLEQDSVVARRSRGLPKVLPKSLPDKLPSFESSSAESDTARSDGASGPPIFFVLIFLGILGSWVISALGGIDTIQRLFTDLVTGERGLDQVIPRLAPAIFPLVFALIFWRMMFRRRQKRAERRPQSARATAQASSSQPPPLPQAGAIQPSGGVRIVGIAFLALWLAGWSVAVLFGFSRVAAGIADGGLEGSDLFILIWTGFAAIGWLLGARMLWRLLTGAASTNKQDAIINRRKRHVSRRDGSFYEGQ
ncbi:MAG: hypothetical protein MRY63_07770 [Neomegalonema sp.]|nr:hypothetical protein [Neomegalonema sp.]